LENRRLAGRAILVTRPREQAAGLARLIEAAGGRAVLFPAIEIQDLPDCPPLDRVRDYDLAIFISPTAVQRALRQRTWPPAVQVAAIGTGTRRELERHGLTAAAPAQGADSEALLALPLLREVKGWRILIIRGEGGRELLGDTLVKRGARVEYAECYRRVRPNSDTTFLLQASARGEVDAVTVSSSEGLDNILAMLGPAGAPLRERVCWFVPHPRVAEHARGCGVAHVIVAGPGDDEMIERLVAYFDAS
jgi:uroporphyrinogen-III synthase